MTTGEIQKAIMNLENDKSPGSNGFGSEWCRTFKEELTPVLLKTLNCTLKKTPIPPAGKKLLYH